jgi:nucleotide-binding universal stress UspA family protein
MSIICGSDLSPASTGALEVACALATQRGDREVVLVHVVASELQDDAVRAALHARLEAQAAIRPPLSTPAASPRPAPHVRFELVIGSPVDTLVRLAEAEGSDLMVIAAHSRGDHASAHLGTTAASVIVRTSVPVLAVRDPAPWLAFARGERPLRVLLGLDESATSDLGIQWMIALSRQGPVDVVLGAIYYPDEAAAHYGLPSRALVDVDPEIERLMERDMLRRYAGSGVAPSPRLTARARRGLGRIGDHMIELADTERVDAIVVGTSHKTALGRLGSVSSVVIENAPQSVVCVPPEAVVATQAAPVLHQALVATDLSPFANRAVRYGFALTQPGGEVHLIHVVKDAAEVDEADLVRQLLALIPAGSTHAVRAHVVRGDDTAVTLAQCAARFGVDVICIASHGRAGISRALVGSVADQLLHATRLPVLVLRPS